MMDFDVLIKNAISMICFVIMLSSKHNSLNVNAQLTIIQHVSGSAHHCVLFSDNTAKCWGGAPAIPQYPNANIGDDMQELGDSLPFINPGTGYTITRLAAGGSTTCMRVNEVGLKCFGSNLFGGAGYGTFDSNINLANGYYGDTLPLVNVGTDLDVYNVTVGQFHTCVVVTDNNVKCFGRNDSGQLGLNNTIHVGGYPNEMGDNLQYTNLGTDVEVSTIHSGSTASHTCVILSQPTLSAQRIKCWGLNHFSQLGYGDTNNRGDDIGEMGDNLPLVDLGTESKVKQIALSFSHSCVLLNNNNVKCWGNGSNGKLGSGLAASISSTGNALPILLIDSGKTVKKISTSIDGTCILYGDNLTVKCIGINSVGQLGQGDTIDRGNTLATTLPNIPAIDLGTGSLHIQSVQSGGDANCATFSGLLIKCFGAGYAGQLGIGSTAHVGMFPDDMGTNLKSVFLLGTISPTSAPNTGPIQSPTRKPTKSPTPPTKTPTNVPTRRPTRNPVRVPTLMPTLPTAAPTLFPTVQPTIGVKTPSPTINPALAGTITAGLGLIIGVSVAAPLICMGAVLVIVVVLMRRSNNKNRNNNFVPLQNQVQVQTRDIVEMNPTQKLIIQPTVTPATSLNSSSTPMLPQPTSASAFAQDDLDKMSVAVVVKHIKV